MRRAVDWRVNHARIMFHLSFMVEYVEVRADVSFVKSIYVHMYIYKHYFDPKVHMYVVYVCSLCTED